MFLEVFSIVFPQLYQQATDILHLLSKLGIDDDLPLHLLAGVDHGRVVASSKFRADRRVRDTKVLPEDVHDDLARTHHLPPAGLLVDRLLVDAVELGDLRDDVLDGDRFRGA